MVRATSKKPDHKESDKHPQVPPKGIKPELKEPKRSKSNNSILGQSGNHRKKGKK